MWQPLKNVLTSAKGAMTNVALGAPATRGGAAGRNVFDFNKSTPMEGLKGILSRGAHDGKLGAVAATGAIGGVVSSATGGDFMQGAAMGVGGAFAARAVHRTLQANNVGLQKGLLKPTAVQQNSEMMGPLRTKGSPLRTKGGALLRNAGSVQRVQERHAMMAGAGLMGMVGGGNGNRKNYRSGFNAHRGNTF